MIRSENGYFGEFGGRYVPEILLPALTELETCLMTCVMTRRSGRSI